MRLIHYSSKHLTEVHDVSQHNGKDGMRGDRGMKPLGLWVSVEGDDDWLAWCRAEDFSLSRLTHPTEIVLDKAAHVLTLGTDDAVRSFHGEYGCLPPYADTIGDRSLFRGSAVRRADVAERYDGIVIAPYIWSLRLDQHVRWYYPWDCASGCIWRSRAVAELRPLATTVTAEPEAVAHTNDPR